MGHSCFKPKTWSMFTSKDKTDTQMGLTQFRWELFKVDRCCFQRLKKIMKCPHFQHFSTSFTVFCCFYNFFLHAQNDHAGKLLRSHAVMDESAFEHTAAE